MINFKTYFKTTTKRIIIMIGSKNIERIDRHERENYFRQGTDSHGSNGRKRNKVRRDRSHKRSWEVQ